MVVRYSILIVVIGLSFTQGVYHKAPTVKKDLSTPLSLDEAYLIVRNTNYSNNIVLFGNKIICEDCDLEQMAVAMPNQNATLVINTKYAYNLELRSWLSNISLLCQMASYKFAEHGTYVLDITQVTPATEVCSIEQIGNPSYYLTPAIVGIVLVVLYVVLVQLWPHIYHSRHFDYFRSNIPHQRLIDNNLSTTSLASAKNLGKQIVNENDGDIICATASTSEVPLASSTHLSDKNIRPTQVLPKRLRALDTFRGFSLMVMIFVNYGGMCSILRAKTTHLIYS